MEETYQVYNQMKECCRLLKARLEVMEEAHENSLKDEPEPLAYMDCPHCTAFNEKADLKCHHCKKWLEPLKSCANYFITNGNTTLDAVALYSPDDFMFLTLGQLRDFYRAEEKKKETEALVNDLAQKFPTCVVDTLTDERPVDYFKHDILDKQDEILDDLAKREARGDYHQYPMLFPKDYEGDVICRQLECYKHITCNCFTCEDHCSFPPKFDDVPSFEEFVNGPVGC